METSILDYGLIGLIFGMMLGLIELVKFVINKYTNKDTVSEAFKNGNGKLILKAIERQNDNHLTHIKDEMNNGFTRVVDCYSQKCDKMIEILGRIDGKLSK